LKSIEFIAIIPGMSHNESFQKRFFNRLKSYGFIQWIIAGIAYIAIKLIYWSNKKEIRRGDILVRFRKKPAIFVLWHGRTMMLSPMIQSLRVGGYVVASKHMDGRMMAKLQRMFGLRTVYGSTHQGAMDVLRKGLRVLKDGHVLCITPDGPKGPRMRLSDGCLYFAKMSGAPIVPVCYSATKSKIWKKWDRFMITKPFGKVICSVGEPIYFNKNNPNEMNDLRKKLEGFMVRQQQELDRETGVPIIEQEPRKK